MYWLLLLLPVLLFLALRSWLPEAIVRPRRRLGNLDPSDLGFRFEGGLMRTTEGIDLSYFYVPATVPARGNLVILHGKDSAKEVYLEYLPQLAPFGYNVLLFDARAHGRSGGQFTSFGFHEWQDVVQAVRKLRYLGGDLPTGVFGHSMGGAVALRALASSDEIDFGVVESAFTHLGQIINLYARRLTGLPLPRQLTDTVLDHSERLARYVHREVHPLEDARAVQQPTLIIHGEQDQRIDVDNGRQLYAALGSQVKELYIIPGAGHDNITEIGDDGYWWRLRAFLATVTHSLHP
ncbi:2-succinyl-6-hydroxy-2, 4-cyclohexadiene-1-carboxylate synthase [Neolewinella maritima]|uniref:2-succinyl-6-hydroxy-2, 4-cyclohexadiene-1-carboxylate synthase n=1 Tax=Neolewinella maritima TaxID=1383882 RepID=A0ABN8F098_9BACT|nr:alpha/beta fold hydrolase [Neolewinella maritima]CAH0999726.1 2-succinyl-6-hydroxy-2, 4-cyclohexadiene-1-carboxylate synthase [Neolewinella maritima]